MKTYRRAVVLRSSNSFRVGHGIFFTEITMEDEGWGDTALQRRIISVLAALEGGLAQKSKLKG